MQKDTDLVLAQASTGERAHVRVKSSSDQAELKPNIESYEADPSFGRMFFVCHSPLCSLQASGGKPIHIWTGEAIARQAIAAGLFDQLMQKAG